MDETKRIDIEVGECPCCGGESNMYGDESRKYIACHGCGICFELLHNMTEKEAVEMWGQSQKTIKWLRERIENGRQHTGQ